MRHQIVPGVEKSTLNILSTCIVAFAAALALFLSPGCEPGKETVQVVDDSGMVIPLVKAKAGSVFIYGLTNYDTTGTIIPGSNGPDTITVSSTDTTIAGITGLLSLTSSANSGTSYSRYEKNDDFSDIFFADTNHDGRIERVRTITYPFASKKSALISNDTLYDSGRDYDVRVDSVVSLGSETLTTAAGTMKVFKAAYIEHSWSFAAAGNLIFHKRDVETYYFAPSIGFFARMMAESSRLDPNGIPLEPAAKATYELISYKLR